MSLSIFELNDFEKMLGNCVKCKKEHCYKKCTNYIEPQYLLEAVCLAQAFKLKQEREENEGDR